MNRFISKTVEDWESEKPENDFETLLREADQQADSEWAEEFVKSIIGKYEKYGKKSLVNNAQMAKLKEISCLSIGGKDF